MGKNKHKNNQLNNELINKSQPTVSIITITQLKRFNCLEIARDLIKEQTYKNIIEWVIVEGSKTQKDAEINSKNIKQLIENSGLDFSIVYVEWANVKLGELRNRGNKTCKGDITVVFDDDDYYFPDRIEHAVNKLINSPAKIAGCSAVMIYDYFLDRLYKFKQFNPNHSTNNCMAWKKEYLDNNTHDSNKEMAEEASFTKEFSQQMVQLESEHTIIVSSHDGNTFNKRELLVGGTHKLNPTLNEVPNIHKYIKEPYYSKYKQLFIKPEKSKYDIIYFAGGFSIKWDPRDMSLGGSEQAIVNLVNNWVKMGKKVAVYGEVPEINFNGVDYISWKKFRFEDEHNIVILWRLYGLWCGAPYNIKAKQILLDCHDNFGGQFPESWEKYGKKVVNKILFKSYFHKEEFEKCCDTKISSDKYVIIPNGIRVEGFLENKEKIQREPFRFCYCSCYRRGIIEIVKYMWPIIYQLEPRAELHVYYGMENIKDEQSVNVLREVLSQPGVMDHGRQPLEIIAREKHRSSFQLYVTNTPIEIDCISIRESLATGCIPLLSNFGVFKDREGIHFDLNPTDSRSYQNIALKISQLMKQPELLNGYREKIKKSPLLINWQEVAKEWIKLIN